MQEALARAKEEEERMKREAEEKEKRREEAIKAKLEKVPLMFLFERLKHTEVLKTSRYF